MTTEILINKILIDGGTQMRHQMDWIAIDEYRQAIQDGAQFPPIVVFQNGTDSYWLGDGFHRVHAAQKAGLDAISADVRHGDKRDAILFAVGANSGHGLRRTNEDKRRAVMALLEDEEWQQWSDGEIARRCVVATITVGRIRAALISNKVIDGSAPRTAIRKGKPYTINIAKIGKPKEPETPKPDLFSASPVAPEPPAPVQEPVKPVVTLAASSVALHNDDATKMHRYKIAPVHLVITSPPYNVGIDYSEHNDDLSTYFEFITDVWRECYKVMVDGARIAVNVPFGVGRNPWVPMSCRVMQTLVEVGFILRGQIIWDKNTSGNRTSWGSFRLPSDPSLRDTTEAIVIAHKGNSKLDLPKKVKQRDDKGTYSPWLMDSDYFMELAQDHWIIAPESAQRIGHPAPFPVELVKRLMHFYAFPGAHIVDPFAGSGTVGVTAKELGCDATLFELDAKYCQLANRRLNGHQ